MEQLNASAFCNATVIRNSGENETMEAHGRYDVVCYDANGNKKWSDVIHNVVTTQGKNFVLDFFLSGGSAVVGPFMGLMSSASYGAGPVAGDTLASHAGWTECGTATNAPYIAQRSGTSGSWLTASTGSKVLASPMSFTITGSGICKGAMMVIGTGATNACQNATGFLLSAGLFSGGDKTLGVSDSLQVNYTLSI